MTHTTVRWLLCTTPTLGNGPLLKCTSNYSPPLNFSIKSLGPTPPPFANLKKLWPPLLCLFINHQSPKSGIAFSSQVPVMQLNYCLPCDLTSFSLFISTCLALWILQALLYRKLYNPTRKKKIWGLISITLEGFFVVNISSCHNQIDK